MNATTEVRGTPDPAFVKSQVADQELKTRRRGQIVPAAVRLFSERGYHRTTIQDIARRAGVSTGLIYQYAQTKEDILLLSLINVMETYKQAIPDLSLIHISEPTRPY